MANKGTYNRKYYLHRMVKKQGYALELEQKHKTIIVKTDLVDAARENKYVTELQKKFSYGVQILNPMMQLILFLALVIITPSCSTTKDPFPFAPSYKYGRYPLKRYKPAKSEKRGKTWINRQWNHEGR